MSGSDQILEFWLANPPLERAKYLLTVEAPPTIVNFIRRLRGNLT
jgi:hypothetical protein